MFQSTHPRGVRRLSVGSIDRRIRFNPRTREGCDVILNSFDFSLQVFQSTHPRGVRRKEATFLRAEIHVSIHAPARGATLQAPQVQLPNVRFNPRTREGCDPWER